MTSRKFKTTVWEVYKPSSNKKAILLTTLDNGLSLGPVCLFARFCCCVAIQSIAHCTSWGVCSQPHCTKWVISQKVSIFDEGCNDEMWFIDWVLDWCRLSCHFPKFGHGFSGRAKVQVQIWDFRKVFKMNIWQRFGQALCPIRCVRNPACMAKLQHECQ